MSEAYLAERAPGVAFYSEDRGMVCRRAAIVTDAYGESIASRPLLGSDHEFQISCVAAANAELHSAICTEVDRGIERLAAASA
jgi:hypothetical protein